MTINQKKPSQFKTSLIDLIAGSAGGCATVLVGQPLDTVKVKMQTFPELHSNAFKCFKVTLVNEGLWRGLYAGTLPALVANVAENSVLFCAYGVCQDLVCTVRGKHEPSTLDKAWAGGLAAFFSSFSLCPTELVKCKLQALRETSKEPVKVTAFQLTSDILKREGIPGMFRGLTSTMAREMPGYFCFFGGYEVSKDFLTHGKPDDATLMQTIIAGGIGGVCLWTSIYPFDVVKSRIQVTSSKEAMTKVLAHVFRTEGLAGLYNGLFPTILRTFPSTGALFVAYEYSKHFMTSHF
ncbi:Mitochondrial ornithine transporter 1 [Halotydeus destructor]|nr:Mitochondrial ornithine transporter 1 [Halotydeus destructor]